MFKVTVRDNDDTQTIEINADVVFTKPFGLFLVNAGTQKEYMFAHRLWETLEFGVYNPASKNTKFVVNVDGNKFNVSKVEFDTNGVLTVSLESDGKHEWSKMFSPNKYQYVIKSNR